MEMHELIDREDPRCLYCNSECDVRVDGFGIGLISHDVNILSCRKCKEIFEIHSINKNGETTYTSFVFTCKRLAVVNSYAHGFAIGGREYLYGKWTANTYYDNYISPFDIDFSDKKKLHKKLKTYLVFS